jgi:hypothetical protein
MDRAGARVEDSRRNAGRDRGQGAPSAPLREEYPVPEAGGITGQDPAVYEGEYVYWPWARVVDAAIGWIKVNAPQEATILDYMCGTGYLLHELRAARPDLRCSGCDLDPGFIAYGRDRYPDVDLAAGSALEYEPPAAADVIVCTGGLHHLPRGSRARFLAKCGDELAPAGAVLIGEEVIAEHDDTASRRSAVLQLYSAILSYVIAADAPPQVLSSAVTAMRKEFVEDGTSKDSRAGLICLLEGSLAIETFGRTWPDGSCQFGDYLAVCRRRGDGSPAPEAR